MYELELFAGAGGGILGKNLIGLTTVGAVEIEPFCRKILLDRQRDRCLPCFPIWDDVRSFSIENPECREYIEWLISIRGKLCISGGFPCQDISPCGSGKGIGGKKSSLWFEMSRIIGEIQPKVAFMENSPMLTTRGLEEVLASLAEMGYDAKWCVFGAGHLNYATKRDRIWILGERDPDYGKLDASKRQERDVFEKYVRRTTEQSCLQDADPDRLVADGFALRESHGLAGSVDRVRALGNGQVPAVAAVAWKILTGGIYDDLK